MAIGDLGRRHWRGWRITDALRGAIAAPVATLACCLLADPASLAQTPSANQPLSIPSDRLPAPACPLLVPAPLAALQPLRIEPSQVARKNRRGCLSPADAFYGADGCPLRLCGQAGVLQLPPEAPAGYGAAP